MKLAKRISPLLIVLVMCIGMFTIPVYAATVTQDGLEVTLSTDKDTYSPNESIVTILSVTNTNDFDVMNVSLESFVPEGYKVSEGSESKLFVNKLEAGEEKKLEVTYVPNAIVNDGSDSSSETDSISSTGNTNSTSSNLSNTTSSNINNDTSTTNTTNSSNPFTGDKGARNIGIAVLALIGCAIVVLITKEKKSRKKMMSLILCFVMFGMLNCRLICAAESDSKSISISETVTVGDKSISLNYVVKYNIEVQEPVSEVDDYYNNNSEEIINVVDANESDDVLTEAETIQMLKDRGFDEYPITYEYTIDGEYVGEIEASESSNEKHPMYQTYYVSENGDVWTIFVIRNTIIANPASYNLEQNLDAQLLFSETETLTSYAYENNKFYETIPKESAVILKVIDRIDVETLDKLTFEEIEKL